MEPTGAAHGLVCEDEPGLAFALRAILHRCGVDTVTVAASGTEALSAAVDAGPHIVVVDIALSGVLGVRLVSELRSLAPVAIIVVLSPFAALRQAVVAAGATEVIDIADIPLVETCLQHLLAHHLGCSCGYSESQSAPTSSVSGRTGEGSPVSVRYVTAGPHRDGRFRPQGD